MIDNKEPKKEKPVMSDEEKFMNRIVYLVAGTIVFIMLCMTTCTMHSNTFDVERLREEAGIKKVENDLEKFKADLLSQKVELQKERLKTIERMVADGIDPFAAACAILGFDNDDMGCMVAAAKSNPNQVNQEE